MATRPAYLIGNGKVIRKDYDFTWISGLSSSQKQKCALSLHEAIRSRMTSVTFCSASSAAECDCECGCQADCSAKRDRAAAHEYR